MGRVTLVEILNGLGDSLGGLARFMGASQWSRMGRGTRRDIRKGSGIFGEVRDGSRNLGEVRDGSGDPQ